MSVSGTRAHRLPRYHPGCLPIKESSSIRDRLDVQLTGSRANFDGCFLAGILSLRSRLSGQRVSVYFSLSTPSPKSMPAMGGRVKPEIGRYLFLQLFVEQFANAAPLMRPHDHLGDQRRDAEYRHVRKALFGWDGQRVRRHDLFDGQLS